jgi:hypothetical protein
MTSLAKERKNRTTQKTCDKAKNPQKQKKSEPVAKKPNKTRGPNGTRKFIWPTCYRPRTARDFASVILRRMFLTRLPTTSLGAGSKKKKGTPPRGNPRETKQHPGLSGFSLGKNSAYSGRLALVCRSRNRWGRGKDGEERDDLGGMGIGMGSRTSSLPGKRFPREKKSQITPVFRFVLVRTKMAASRDPDQIKSCFFFFPIERK